jgi:hypothetical protein
MDAGRGCRRPTSREAVSKRRERRLQITLKSLELRSYRTFTLSNEQWLGQR